MKLLLTAVALAALTLPVHAISRYNSTSMTCQELRAVIDREGAAILRWTSKRTPGLPRYGRYVSDDRFCSSGQRATWSSAPSSDRDSCRLYECKQYSRDDDDFFWLRH